MILFSAEIFVVLLLWLRHLLVILLTAIVFKDYRYHDFPNTEFSYFLTIDTRQ